MTSILAGYTTYTPEQTRGQIFLSITKYGILISAAVVNVLNHPETVSVYFNKAEKKMAIKAQGAHNFASAKTKYVRWSSKRLKRAIEAVAGESITDKRFLGEYFEDEQVVIFSLGDTAPVKKKSTH